MAGKTKNNKGSGSGGQKKSKGGSSGWTPSSAGMLAVDHERNLSGLVRRNASDPAGQYSWAPATPLEMVMDLDQYPPLAVRHYAKISFVSSVELHFAPKPGAATKTATKWSSGWVKLEDLLVIKFRAFGSEAPAGYFRISCAGLAPWSVDQSQEDEPDDEE